MSSGGRSQDFFGQFLKNLGQKGVGVRPPPPPSGSAPLGEIFVFIFFKRRKTKISPKGPSILLIITMAIIP